MTTNQEGKTMTESKRDQAIENYSAQGGGAEVKVTKVWVDIDTVWTRVLFGSLSFAAVAYGLKMMLSLG